uniref:Uncharacterized protein isoform X2 n=1 Tax=Nicotiana tabacum TaxID=4097 RepID=A0A1S4AXZ5_TOBAC|nr:PREDICTED: uncharacterized protein LOC107802551 isoform X2 [Nicotiana tabacum]
MRYRKDKCDLIIGGLVLIVGSWVMGVKGSIHEYKNEAFIPRFNSFFFHGGSEGLYASKVQDSPLPLPLSDDTNNKPLNGKSFIRCRCDPESKLARKITRKKIEILLDLKGGLQQLLKIRRWFVNAILQSE